SGAGIAVGLIVRRLFGVSIEADALSIDPVMPPALNGLRIELPLLGHPVEVEYRVGQVGHGVTAVALNDEMLALDFRANPHRKGAARVSRTFFSDRLKRGRN